MRTDVSYHRGWVIVKIVGGVDSFTFPIFENDLNILLKTGVKKIVIDLNENDFLNLNGFRLIKHTFEYLKDNKGSLVILTSSKYFLEQINFFVDQDEITIKQKIEQLIYD